MWPVTYSYYSDTVMFSTKPITLNKYYMNYCKYLTNLKFIDIIIPERKPCTKTRSSPPNDFILRLLWQTHKSPQTIVVGYFQF